MKRVRNFTYLHMLPETKKLIEEEQERTGMLQYRIVDNAVKEYIKKVQEKEEVAA